jgi:hypothetical protein
VFEQYKAQGNPTYLPTPFAIVAGGDGGGFHVATSRRVSTIIESRPATAPLGISPREQVMHGSCRPTAVLRSYATCSSLTWPYQYFLGDDLLVAPVIQSGVASWRVYLPAGKWVDPWTERDIVGPATIERPTQMDEIPVYVRAANAGDLLRPFREVKSR